jgi:hypothetical protein
VRRLPVAADAPAASAVVAAANVPSSATILADVPRSAVANAADGPLVSGAVFGLTVSAAAPPAGPIAIPYPDLATALTALATVSGVPLDSNPGGCTVTDDLLTATGSTLPPTGDETSPAGHHGSSANPAGAGKAAGAAVIAWDADGNSMLERDSAELGGSQDWLDDFLNRRGQSQTQWNPNAGIRVRPTATAAAA